ncbi:MAG TPA: cell envelope integrity protein TolA [Steroidobacteraceae bacterium]|jgi:colicin import membrane protein
MSERRSDRVLSVFLSILVHAAIVGALVWGWWQYRAPKPAPQTLAIEATVVHGAAPSAPAPPAPTPPVPQPTPTQPAPTPPPDPQAEQRAAEQKAAQLQREQTEKDAAAKAEAERKAQAEVDAKAEAEAKAKAQAEADAKAEAEAKAKAQALAAAKAKADAEAKAEAKAKADAAAKVEQERAQREADLRSQMQAEEHLDAARSNGALAQYQAMISARIQHAWIRPPSAHAGISCEVRITQVPGGAVTAVQVGICNGDSAVKQSIADAAYRASPLPAPPDPALFDRDLVVTFAPND